MVAIRAVLLAALAVCCAVAVIMLIVNPSESYGVAIGLLIVFVLMMLGLGPLWPTPEKMKRWKFDLPTDNPKVAIIWMHFFLAAWSFYEAWSLYDAPRHKWYRIERTIAALFGDNSVAPFWLVMGLFFCWSMVYAYKQYKAA